MKTYNENQAITSPVIVATPIVKSVALMGRGLCHYLVHSRELIDAVLALSILMTICGVCLLTVYSAFGIL